jgi:hypothetical protein
MKRMLWVMALFAPLWAGETLKEMFPPFTVEAAGAKTVYEPIEESLDPKSEERIQQQNGVIGGRGVPMHSYGETKEEPTSCGDK